MKKTFKQQVDAMRAVLNFCQLQPIVWAAIQAFANAIAALSLQIQSIETTEAQQDENRTGITRNKSAKKKAMANEAVAVARVLQSYALNINDMILYAKMKIQFSSIFRGDNDIALSKCKFILEHAEDIELTELEPYGISAAVLNALETSIEEFQENATAPRNAKAQREALTTTLKTLVREGSLMMRDKVLFIGRQFKVSNPEFYQQLVINAKIVSQTIHSKLRITVKDDVTGLPIEGCTVSVDGTEKTGTTTIAGNCTLSQMPLGLQGVIISKDGYTEKYIQLEFKAGKSTARIVMMTPEFDLITVKNGTKEKISAE